MQAAHENRTSLQVDGPLSTSLGEKSYTQRVLIATGLLGRAVLLGTLFVLASDVFFLFYLAVMFAVLLRTMSDALSARTKLGPVRSLVVVTLALTAAMGFGAFATGALAAREVEQLSTDLPGSRGHDQEYVGRFP